MKKKGALRANQNKPNQSQFQSEKMLLHSL
jgi:hypothetical protein